MKIAIIIINQDGEKIANRLKMDIGIGAKIFDKRKTKNKSLKELFGDIFCQYKKIIFIGAIGIAVRQIASLITNKYDDPAVVCVDSAGRYSISLLSGHEGGANELAFLAAKSLGAFPVITTASEAKKKYILGIGTKKNISKRDVINAVGKVIKKAKISSDEIRIAATIDIKKNEKGLIEACKELKLPIVFISKNSIRNFRGDASSEIVKKYLDLNGVCEPCACIAGKEASLILRKQISKGTAIAIAKENFLL